MHRIDRKVMIAQIPGMDKDARNFGMESFSGLLVLTELLQG